MTLFAALILSLAAAPTISAQRKTAKSKTPRTVTDFYMLLPAKYFPFVDRVKKRRDLIESENIKLGYLNFAGNRPFMPLENEMLLLRRMSGAAMLVIAYTDCSDDCQAVLRFVEYENGRWTEADAAPKFDVAQMRAIYRRKTGRDAVENPKIYYSLSPIDKSLTVNFAGQTSVEIYKLEWDGNVYDFAAPI